MRKECGDYSREVLGHCPRHTNDPELDRLRIDKGEPISIHLKDALDMLFAGVNNLTLSLTDLEMRMDERVKKMSGRISDIEARMDAFDERLTRMERGGSGWKVDGPIYD